MEAGRKCVSLEPGMKIGRWSLQDRVLSGENGEKKWFCRCDCGTERFVLERSLKYGASLSCGCLRREALAQAVSPDLKGRTFGQLTVLERAQSKGTGVRWRCRCDCGEIYEVLGTLLINGRRTCCPRHRGGRRISDIAGRRFGQLTALHSLGRTDSRGSALWLCRCDCGREVELSYNSLMYTNQKSCGCRKRQHEQNLPNYLTHVAGTSVDMLRSKKLPSDNTTGYRGVYWIRGKYVAKIVFQKKAYYLGSYDRIEEAARARMDAEALLFDGAAEFYALWQDRAAEDPLWGQEHPVQITVEQKEDKSLSVRFQPELA